jgi:hypothetical protein
MAANLRVAGSPARRSACRDRSCSQLVVDVRGVNVEVGVGV